MLMQSISTFKFSDLLCCAYISYSLYTNWPHVQRDADESKLCHDISSLADKLHVTKLDVHNSASHLELGSSLHLLWM